MRTGLADAPRLYGPQKGATEEDVEELTRRFSGHPYGDLPGSGAAGGLGAALASLGAELVPGAELVLELLRFDPRGYDLVVTGEAPSTRRRGRGGSGRCTNGVRTRRRHLHPLRRTRAQRRRGARSGDPANAYDDLVTLATRLGQARATR